MKQKLLAGLLAVTAAISVATVSHAANISVGELTTNIGIPCSPHAFQETDYVVHGDKPAIVLNNCSPAELFLNVPGLGVEKFFVPPVTERALHLNWGSELKYPYTVTNAAGEVVFSGFLLSPDALIPPPLGPALTQETLNSWNRTIQQLQASLTKPIYDEYTHNKYMTSTGGHEYSAPSRNVRGYW